MTPSTQPISVEGHNGRVQFDGFTITITRKGFRTHPTIGNGEQQFTVDALADVHWMSAGFWLEEGFIQFETARQGSTRSSARWQTKAEAASDEHSVLFKGKPQEAKFEELRQAVKLAIAYVRRWPQWFVPESSVAQLMKLNQMYEQKLLSREEFAKFKRQIP
ncbi:DUF4429 domain-containing protein [Dactylosporangium sp. NPDC049140]|uniref:DUF4429 domain-containing protein n=1 Tax=Dactylosporangium sp. NPDC049140 TaxID=3155647 RepID=UPI0033E9A78E